MLVIWKGLGHKRGLVFATVYQWHGRWIASELGELESNPLNMRVEVAADFFAIVTPNQQTSVHLFSANKLHSGQWETYVPDCVIGIENKVASGRNFLALLDKQSGKLFRFTRDGSTWRDEPNQALGGGNDKTILTLTARDNFIITASATSDNMSLPELRLYYLDKLTTWRVTSLSVDESFFKEKGYQWDAYGGGAIWTVKSDGTKALELYAGETFVLLQAASSVAYGAESFEVYRHFIYRWSEDYASLQLEFEPCLDVSKGVEWDCIKRHNSESVIRKELGLVQSTVVGDQIIIDVWEDNSLIDRIKWTPKQKRFVYQYSGCGWYERIFKNDQVQNNYIGQNSFSTTENGQAQYWEFNPMVRGWQPNMPKYKDGNASLFEKLIWPIIMLVGGIVTLPLDFGPALVIDLLFLTLKRE